jgi:hypothetical protein
MVLSIPLLKEITVKSAECKFEFLSRVGNCQFKLVLSTFSNHHCLLIPETVPVKVVAKILSQSSGKGLSSS